MLRGSPEKLSHSPDRAGGSACGCHQDLGCGTKGGGLRAFDGAREVLAGHIYISPEEVPAPLVTLWVLGGKLPSSKEAIKTQGDGCLQQFPIPCGQGVVLGQTTLQG